MAKFQITFTNSETVDVTADGYAIKDGYFQFSGEGGFSQVMAVRTDAVLMVEKLA